MRPEWHWFYSLAVALAIGLLVGIERGWQARAVGEGERAAGLRTFALIGLLGGLSGLLSRDLGLMLPGFVFVGVSLLAAAGHVAVSRERGDFGLTTEVALLLTLLLATVAGRGELVHAATGAVLMLVLLGCKAQLHGWLARLESKELAAGIRLLLISVVLLPLLPNEGYGPWKALNPFVIWWMVVMIATISFAGYFAIRIAGARAGVIVTGLFGGLAASTATTLTLARINRRKNAKPALLAGGILLACGTMFPRMLLVATAVHPPLFASLWVPSALMAAIVYGAAIWALRHGSSAAASADLSPGNPMEFQAALTFGAVLGLVMLAGRALTEWFGDAGLYALAAASGVADVDPITLSLARMSAADLAIGTATGGIVLAGAINSLVKTALAAGAGGRDLGVRVGVPLVASAMSGLAWIVLRTQG